MSWLAFGAIYRKHDVFESGQPGNLSFVNRKSRLTTHTYLAINLNY